jgi:AcrR family transcriptional regulator
VYAGKTAQDRSDTRRRRFIDAAVTLIATRGMGNTTVRGICDQAGLSTRFFYESFDSLDAIAAAAYDDCVGHAFGTIFPATTAAGPDRFEMSRASLAAMVDYLTEYPNNARVVLLEALGTGVLAAKRRDTMHLLKSTIATLAQTTYAIDEHDPIVNVTATLIAGGVAELMIGWLDGSVELPREQLIDQCARLIVEIGDTALAVSAAPEPDNTTSSG